MSAAAPCEGTRQPVTNRNRRVLKPTGAYAARYGRGTCQVCGKVVTCHKDGTAVNHQAGAPQCVRCGSTDVRVFDPWMCASCYVASLHES
jgi:hypothetical protein